MYDFNKKFEYENGFYLTSEKNRIAKLLAHYELYKMIIKLPGEVVECGVFKGASLVRFATFRDLLETTYSRKIIGFDIFGKFPNTSFEEDKPFLKTFFDTAGDQSIAKEKLKEIFQHKKIDNFELIKGDINITVPKYVEKNPQMRISLLHIDTDIYEPALTVLKYMYARVVKGGVIVFDDYGTFPGETKAVDEFFADKHVIIKKLPISYIPAYVVKN